MFAHAQKENVLTEHTQIFRKRNLDTDNKVELLFNCEAKATCVNNNFQPEDHVELDKRPFIKERFNQDSTLKTGESQTNIRNTVDV